MSPDSRYFDAPICSSPLNTSFSPRVSTSSSRRFTTSVRSGSLPHCGSTSSVPWWRHSVCSSRRAHSLPASTSISPWRKWAARTSRCVGSIGKDVASYLAGSANQFGALGLDHQRRVAAVAPGPCAVGCSRGDDESLRIAVRRVRDGVTLHRRVSLSLLADATWLKVDARLRVRPTEPVSRRSRGVDTP